MFVLSKAMGISFPGSSSSASIGLDTSEGLGEGEGCIAGAGKGEGGGPYSAPEVALELGPTYS